jgi:hypothetical protein
MVVFKLSNRKMQTIESPNLDARMMQSRSESNGDKIRYSSVHRRKRKKNLQPDVQIILHSRKPQYVCKENPLMANLSLFDDLPHSLPKYLHPLLQILLADVEGRDEPYDFIRARR